MSTKWATFVFWNVINPTLYTHHTYYRKKVLLDRMLEKRSGWFNVACGVLVGTTGYLMISPLLIDNRAAVDAAQDTKDVLRILKLDTSKEIPIILLEKAKSDIVAKVYVTNDKADIRRQKEEMARLKAQLGEMGIRTPLQL